MRPQDRALARAQLDKRLNTLPEPESLARPPRGWIKAIREALGLTSRQFAKRLGVSQPRVIEIEGAEVSGAVTLDSLQRAANALECRLVYALVPRRPLQTLVEERAEQLARKRLKTAAHTMALEAQNVDEDAQRAQLQQLVRTLMDRPGSDLWDDE
jgi:predicted DNA-binding mobile mystery protein A